MHILVPANLYQTVCKLVDLQAHSSLVEARWHSIYLADRTKQRVESGRFTSHTLLGLC